MTQDETEKSETLKYVGFILLGLGILVAGLIISEVFTFFSKPQENILVQYLTTELSKTNFVEVNQRPIVLKESGAFAMAIFLFGMLIWTASSVCHHIIKAGLSILTRTYSADIARLKLYVSQLGFKIDKYTSNN